MDVVTLRIDTSTITEVLPLWAFAGAIVAGLQCRTLLTAGSTVAFVGLDIHTSTVALVWCVFGAGGRTCTSRTALTLLTGVVTLATVTDADLRIDTLATTTDVILGANTLAFFGFFVFLAKLAFLASVTTSTTVLNGGFGIETTTSTDFFRFVGAIGGATSFGTDLTGGTQTTTGTTVRTVGA